jgi:hypothetical protein
MAKKNELKTEQRRAEINLNEVLSGLNSSPTILEATVTNTPVIHRNVTLIEFVNSRVLDEVLRATNLKEMIVRRLSETIVLIDYQQQDEFIKTLTKKGYEPKIIESK